MLIKLSELKSLVREALVDKIRLPDGPNSRDDAEDRDLNDPMNDRVNIEEAVAKQTSLIPFTFEELLAIVRSGVIDLDDEAYAQTMSIMDELERLFGPDGASSVDYWGRPASMTQVSIEECREFAEEGDEEQRDIIWDDEILPGLEDVWGAIKQWRGLN